MDFLMKWLIIILITPPIMYISKRLIIGGIGRLRKELKGRKYISNSNFVKVRKKAKLSLLAVTILLFPLGSISFFSLLNELVMLFYSFSKINWEVLILGIVFTPLYILYVYILLTFRNKIEIIDSQTIKIIKGRKSCKLHRKEITYTSAKDRIKLYNSSGKRMITVTHLYDNIQSLINWLETSNEAVENLNNLFDE